LLQERRSARKKEKKGFEEKRIVADWQKTGESGESMLAGGSSAI